MKTQKYQTWCLVAGTVSLIIMLTPAVFGQGSLTPAGAPAPTMKTLDQIYNAITNISASGGEKRIDVLTLPADGAALHAITSPGSYYLSTNIIGVNGSAICGFSVEADNVTVDLNGFSLLGNNDAWSGICVYGTRTNVTLKNGSVTAWGNAGVWADGGKQLVLEHLQCNQNKSSAGGVYALNTLQCIIKDCQALGNGGKGFYVNQGSLIEGCTVGNNANWGIYLSDDCVVKDCLVLSNFSGGISLGNRNDVEHNTCNGNGTGIYAPGNDCRIEGNQCLFNTQGFNISGTENVVVRNFARNQNFLSDGYILGNGNVVGNMIFGTSGSVEWVTTGSGWENFDFYTIP